MSIALRRGESVAARLAPLATCVLAVFADALPVPAGPPDGAAPLLAFAVLFHWSVHEPERCTPLVAFLLGLLLDALTGMPLGHFAILFVLARLLLGPGQRFLAGQPFAIVWLSFVLAALIAEGVRWLAASLWWQHAFPFAPAAHELLLTIAAYPVVSWLLASLRLRLARGYREA